MEKRITAFDRTHTVYVVFHFCGFYALPRVLITDARSFRNNDRDHVADQRFSLNNGLLRVLIAAGSEKLVLLIVI